MPIPKPAKKERKNRFISRCVSFLVDEGLSTERSVAICEREFDISRIRGGEDLEDIQEDNKIFDLPREYNEESLIAGVYEGVVTPRKLPEDLYSFTALSLMGASWFSFGLPSEFERGLPWLTARQNALRLERAIVIKNNLSVFSGAKTFQNVVDLSNAVFDDAGVLRPFSEFKKVALSINKQYNKNWLATEYQAAFRQAESSETWLRIQEDKNRLPLLKYVTVGDDRVRPEHSSKNGLIYPVDHTFWKTWMPPNGWYCRCIAIQLSEGVVSDELFPPNEDNSFGRNIGEEGIIFPKTHPYLDVPSGFKKAKMENFGLNTPSDNEVRKFIKIDEG